MIKDEIGNELVYWPISGLGEGESSGVLTFNVPTPQHLGRLRASIDSRVKVFCRVAGVGSYVDISSTSIDLAVLAGPDTDFEIYVEAQSPIEGLERVPISVVAGTSSSAGWSV